MNKFVTFSGLFPLTLLFACGEEADYSGASAPPTSVTTTPSRALPGDAAEAFKSLPPGSRVRDLAELAKMQRFVAAAGDPRVFRGSIQIDADVFDCVDVHLQHGFDRRIDVLSTPPEGGSPTPLIPGEAMANLSYSAKSEHCEEGTVPRRRITLNEMARFEKFDDYFARVPSHLRPQEEAPGAGPSSVHQYATHYQPTPTNGAEAMLNVWSPSTELTSEFSLSQLWISGGHNVGETLQTVEAGWQVYPDKYGDGRARLFIYFTPDNYTSGGCYNVDCSAFVQVDNSVALGSHFASYSTANGAQLVSGYRIQQNATGDWWVQIAGTWLGFWPRSLFASPGLSDGGTRVTFGGEIIDNRTSDRHTQTDMGSGAFPSGGFGLAAYQRSMAFYQGLSAPKLTSVGGVASASGANCYDITTSTASDWGRYIFFGGPGYDPVNCF